MSPGAWLEFRKVSKAFGSCQANRNVSFEIEIGSIHALVGENGAGKSTIMKILFGLYQKDEGEILLRGRPLEFQSPIQAKKEKIGMVHQHFMLAGPMTGMDHVFLDETSNTQGWSLMTPLHRSEKLRQLQALSEKYQMPVPWESPVADLSVGYQQRIEILKLLLSDAEILILDEPTAVLTPQESKTLFSQLRELQKAGKTIILITHKLKEVMSLASKVTVFRQGEVVAQKKISETSPAEISELMIGRKLNENSERRSAVSRDIEFEVRNLSWGPLRDLSFKIHRGEILGVAGVEGNGQSELIQILLNPRSSTQMTGDLLWKGQSIRRFGAKEMKFRGMSYFPEDRLRQGALLQNDLESNFILGLHRSPAFQFHGWLKRKIIRQQTLRALNLFDVRPADPQLVFQYLSGGNQQKLVVARELSRNPSFLLAAQPTRGVDIGAIERIHHEILRVRENLGSVLLISSDLDEVMKLADRIVVFYQGRIAGELERAHFDEMALGLWMTGAVS